MNFLIHMRSSQRIQKEERLVLNVILPISFQERSMSDADNAGSNDQTDDASHCTSKPIDINVPSGSKSKSGSLLGMFDFNSLLNNILTAERCIYLCLNSGVI